MTIIEDQLKITGAQTVGVFIKAFEKVEPIEYK